MTLSPLIASGAATHSVRFRNLPMWLFRGLFSIPRLMIGARVTAPQGLNTPRCLARCAREGVNDAPSPKLMSALLLCDTLRAGARHSAE